MTATFFSGGTRKRRKADSCHEMTFNWEIRNDVKQPFVIIALFFSFTPASQRLGAILIESMALHSEQACHLLRHWPFLQFCATPVFASQETPWSLLTSEICVGQSNPLLVSAPRDVAHPRPICCWTEKRSDRGASKVH